MNEPTGGAPPPRAPRVPRATHRLAHVCVCAAVLFSWTLPGGWGGAPHTLAPATAFPSEAETDERLQRAARVALGGREGTVVVMDARTGRLRALAGASLAFEEATPPGSVVKPFTALAALRSGVLDEGTRVSCRGGYRRGDFKVTCAHPRHRLPFDPAQALAESCNHFFSRVGDALDGEAFTDTLASFGFGARTGGGGGREAAGALPRARAGVAEMLGESERLLVTPAQLLTAYAALFNGGRLLEPRRATSAEFTPRERARVSVEPRERALLLAGMRGAVAHGTASRAGLATLGVHVFGKTGTATPREGFRPQGWFVGFAADGGASDAPPERVGLAVLVFLRRAHGAECAAAARTVFEEYARSLAPRAGAGDARSLADDATGGARAFDSRNAPGGPAVRVHLARADVTLTLPLEEYVFGVLAAEGSVETEAEALKALAVVSRSYTLRNLRRHARDGYDLCDSTHCQRFTPVGDEGARPEFYGMVRRALRETAGEVLRDASGRVAESYFSAACGGATADPSSLWGAAHAPAHLRGVRDEFCAGTAHRAWTDSIPSARLLEALRADARSDVGARLDSVRVVRRDRSGRAELVALEGERRRVLRGWDFKIIVGRTLGWSVLKSSRFEVARAGAGFVFRGSGFGHGLGLCQAGAHVMAARGATYRQILSHYLPGAGLRTANSSIADTPIADRGSRIADRGLMKDSVPFVNASHSSRGVECEAEEQRAFHQSFAVLHSALRTPHSAILTVRNPHSAIRNRSVLSSEHFRVSFPARAPRREAEEALRVLEAARADVTRRMGQASLGAAGLGLTELYVYETTGEFVGATGQPAWVAAVTRGRRIESQPLGVLRRRGSLAATLRHEFTHVACEALGRGLAPRWLVEGLAAHVAGEGVRLARTPARASLTPEEIERRLAHTADAQEMRALYAAAYREVSALIRREGEAAVWRRVAAGQSF